MRGDDDRGRPETNRADGGWQWTRLFGPALPTRRRRGAVSPRRLVRVYSDAVTLPARTRTAPSLARRRRRRRSVHSTRRRRALFSPARATHTRAPVVIVIPALAAIAYVRATLVVSATAPDHDARRCRRIVYYYFIVRLIFFFFPLLLRNNFFSFLLNVDYFFFHPPTTRDFPTIVATRSRRDDIGLARRPVVDDDNSTLYVNPDRTGCVCLIFFFFFIGKKNYSVPTRQYRADGPLAAADSADDPRPL